MTFCKGINLLMILFLLFSCTEKVEDKNSGLSNSEKKELKTEKTEESIAVTKVSFLGINDIKEDETAEANIISRYYTVEVCFKDRNLPRGMGNKRVYIDGEYRRTNPEGCIVQEHEIELDYSLNKSCMTFEKEISFGGNKKKIFRYSIDYLNNEIANLDVSKGCVVEKTEKQSKKLLPVTLKDVYLGNGGILTKLRSDIRWVKHKTRIESCLEATITGKPVSNARFHLVATNLETGEVSVPKNKLLKTDRDGCFKTDIVSSYEQYRTTHWMEVKLDIEILSGALAGKKAGRSVYINPWETSFKLYGIGEEGRVPDEIKLNNDYAKLHMDGVMYIQIGNDTKKMTVNDYLGLTLSKSYQVVLNPYIDREFSYMTGKKYINRLDFEGKFKLSMVLLAPKQNDIEINKDNFENFEFITGVEKIVNIKNGLVNTVVNIPFKMVDLPKLSLRTMSIFKIEPVEDTGLRSSIVTGFFKARIQWIKTNVFEDNQLNMPEYVDKAWKHINDVNQKKKFSLETIDDACSEINDISKEECLKGVDDILNNNVDQKVIDYRLFADQMFGKLREHTQKMNTPFTPKISPKRIFTNHLKTKFEDIEIHDLKTFKEEYDINFTKKDFDTLMPRNRMYHNFTPNMAEELCRYAFHKDGKYKKVMFFYFEKNYKNCKDNPEKYFNIKAVRHVDKVTGINDAYTNGFTLNIGENFSVSQGESDTETFTKSIFASGDIGVKFPPIPMISDYLGIGIKAGAGVNKSWSHSKGDGYQYSENAHTGKSLGVEKFVVDISGEFERCFLIQSKDILDVKLAQKRRMEATGYTGSYAIPVYDLNDPYYSPMKNFDLTYYVCDTNLKSEDFTEAWYFVQSRIDSNMAVDQDAVTERRILKSFRGTDSYWELKQGLRDAANHSLIMDNIGVGTPEDVVFRSWGHLLGDAFPEEEAAKFLIDNVEGSFPGTIEGQGSTHANQPEKIDIF